MPLRARQACASAAPVPAKVAMNATDFRCILFPPMHGQSLSRDRSINNRQQSNGAPNAVER
jgi:hypothetical protein